MIRTVFIPSPLMWGTLATGTLNDANLDDEITTSVTGALCWIGISLENLANGDDFDIELNRWDGAAWQQYKKSLHGSKEDQSKEFRSWELIGLLTG